MKGRYGGPVPVDQLFQALWQDRDFFRRHRITHLKGVFLYFTACDADGNTVTIHDERGAAVEGYNTAGCYNCAAAAYDGGDGLTPETVLFPAPTEH